MSAFETPVLLFCERSTPASGGNAHAQFPRGEDIRKSLPAAVRQALGSDVESESCDPGSLSARVRALKEAGMRPVVIWMASSPGTHALDVESAKILRQFTSEFDVRLLFLITVSGAEHSRIAEAFGDLHSYLFPNADASFSTEIEYWRTLNELASDISRMLKGEHSGDKGRSIFLAPVPEQIEPIARKLRSDLESRGFRVRSKISSESVDELLASATVSVHLFGHAAFAPSDRAANHAMEVFRSTLAFARAHPEVRILGWTDIPSLGVDVESLLGDRILRESKEFSSSTEVVQSTIEDFKSLLYDRIGHVMDAPTISKVEAAGPSTSSASSGAQLYIIYDPRDAEAARPITNFLEHEGISVLLPEFPSEQSGQDRSSEALRAMHNEKLRLCDAALIVYGGVQEQWVRMKQQDLLRAMALGRKKNLAAKGVFLCSNKTEGKLRFSAPDMMIINGFDSTASLGPFLQRLSTAR